MIRVKLPFGGITPGADGVLRGRDREVRAAEQGPHHDQAEHPDAPHPAARSRAGDPRARRVGAVQPRGLREHGPQRDRRPVGGRSEGRAVRHDAVRGRVRALLRAPPDDAGDAAKDQDRVRRLPARPRDQRHPRHRLPRAHEGDRGTRHGPRRGDARRRRHLDHAARGAGAVRVRRARQRRVPEARRGRLPDLRPPGLAAPEQGARADQGVRRQVRDRRAAQPGRGGAEGRVGRRTRLLDRGQAVPGRRARGRARAATGIWQPERRPDGVRALPRGERARAEAGGLRDGRGESPARRPHARAVPRSGGGHAPVRRRLRTDDRAAELRAAVGARGERLRRVAARCRSSASARPAHARSPTSSHARGRTRASSGSRARWV